VCVWFNQSAGSHEVSSPCCEEWSIDWYYLNVIVTLLLLPCVKTAVYIYMSLSHVHCEWFTLNVVLSAVFTNCCICQYLVNIDTISQHVPFCHWHYMSTFRLCQHWHYVSILTLYVNIDTLCQHWHSMSTLTLYVNVHIWYFVIIGMYAIMYFWLIIMICFSLLKYAHESYYNLKKLIKC